MKNFILTIFVGAACVSCGSNAGNTGSSSNQQVKVTDSNAAFNTNTTTSGVQGQAPASTTNLPAGNTSTAGLNPAHGQPGHRCEVAVGAPLNSAPATKAVTPSITQPAISTPSPSVSLPASGNSGTARLNPPHGQPGHDCSVEVGKPLKQ
jgi:hypothetical protein